MPARTDARDRNVRMPKKGQLDEFLEQLDEFTRITRQRVLLRSLIELPRERRLEPMSPEFR